MKRMRAEQATQQSCQNNGCYHHERMGATAGTHGERLTDVPNIIQAHLTRMSEGRGYSERRVVAGSIRAARQAGMPQAIADTAASRKITPR
jgi:hypothetical protein